jgi:predicted RNA-binding Zn-ribbon protein involved in translation (DUF1610 family)
MTSPLTKENLRPKIPVMMACPGCGEEVSTSDLAFSDYFEDYVCDDCRGSVMDDDLLTQEVPEDQEEDEEG